MSFPDITGELRRGMPELRGRLEANAPLAPFTWFRVGGPAQVLFTPADEADLACFLAQAPAELPVTVIGLTSNLLVREGGIPGVVVKLARGFSQTAVEPDCRLRAGAAVPDIKVARAAAEAGIAGLAFYRGIPGSIGGALRMNAGAHGSETADVLLEARAVDRRGRVHVLSREDMCYAYRHCGAPADFIFTQALFQGTPGDPAEIARQMDAVSQYRQDNQPVRERTGGSTFRNPPGLSAWRLIDAAGCRGLRVGGAEVSHMHCNFLINTGKATAEDIERLGETVRARVRSARGVTLSWEIVRLGLPLPGRPTGESLVEAGAA